MTSGTAWPDFRGGNVIAVEQNRRLKTRISGAFIFGDDLYSSFGRAGIRRFTGGAAIGAELAEPDKFA